MLRRPACRYFGMEAGWAGHCGPMRWKTRKPPTLLRYQRRIQHVVRPLFDLRRGNSISAVQNPYLEPVTPLLYYAPLRTGVHAQGACCPAKCFTFGRRARSAPPVSRHQRRSGWEGPGSHQHPERKPLLPVSLKIANVSATPQRIALSPGATGHVFEIDVVVPSDIAPGSVVPVVLVVGSATSPDRVTIAVK